MNFHPPPASERADTAVLRLLWIHARIMAQINFATLISIGRYNAAPPLRRVLIVARIIFQAQINEFHGSVYRIVI